MQGLVFGIVSLVFGVIGFIYWWSDLLTIVKGILPTALIIIGLTILSKGNENTNERK